MGGQDWPKAIYALEEVAKKDKNRQGPYICIFGIAMERGTRSKRKNSKTKMEYSINTELWLSDYFWPFLSNLSYEEIMLAVSDFLAEQGIEIENRTIGIPAPKELIESFGDHCRQHGLIDDSGKFHDRQELVKFFCTKSFSKNKSLKHKSNLKND